MHRKIEDIKTLVEKYKPHVLALGEANILSDHDQNDIKIKDYNLYLSKSIDNPQMKVSRVAVYTHKSLIVKRRNDLEDETIQTIWMELGHPRQKKTLVMAGYRQWRLPGRGEETVRISEQRSRWKIILDQWEKALKEEKEVLVLMDANLDSLTWTKDTSLLPPNHNSIKLRGGYNRVLNYLFGSIFALIKK